MYLTSVLRLASLSTSWFPPVQLAPKSLEGVTVEGDEVVDFTETDH